MMTPRATPAMIIHFLSDAARDSVAIDVDCGADSTVEDTVLA